MGKQMVERPGVMVHLRLERVNTLVDHGPFIPSRHLVNRSLEGPLPKLRDDRFFTYLPKAYDSSFASPGVVTTSSGMSSTSSSCFFARARLELERTMKCRRRSDKVWRNSKMSAPRSHTSIQRLSAGDGPISSMARSHRRLSRLLRSRLMATGSSLPTRGRQ